MAKKTDPVRKAALAAIREVTSRNKSLTDVLYPVNGKSPASELKPIDRALFRQLVYGVLRWYFRLQAIVDLMQTKPFKSRDGDIPLILYLGLFQLIYLRVPDHAAVDTSVNLARAYRTWAAGPVNAMLRRFLRERDQLLARVDEQPQRRYSHPVWMVDTLRRDWPQGWQSILQENNEPAPMWLRVNTVKISTLEYQQQLQQQSIGVETLAALPSALRLLESHEAAALPGYAQGQVSVQDAAAQLAAQLLDVQQGQVVLDACAAPGGKSGAILESQPELSRLVLLDKDESRLAYTRQQLQRLGWQALLDQGGIALYRTDAAAPDSWPAALASSKQHGFDRILLDAPCSASGVIRRHPDIKLLRRVEDVQELARIQAQMLDALWPLLQPGGVLVYATCSIFKQENEDQITAFLQRQSDAQALDISPDLAFTGPHQSGVGVQIFPGQSYLDGFYYAKIAKRANKELL